MYSFWAQVLEEWRIWGGSGEKVNVEVWLGSLEWRCVQ
jgi:hypothetical protein